MGKRTAGERRKDFYRMIEIIVISMVVCFIFIVYMLPYLPIALRVRLLRAEMVSVESRGSDASITMAATSGGLPYHGHAMIQLKNAADSGAINLSVDSVFGGNLRVLSAEGAYVDLVANVDGARVAVVEVTDGGSSLILRPTSETADPE